MKSTLLVSLVATGSVALNGVAQPSTQVLTGADATTPYHESLRPVVHFTAKKNWLNDPNGLVYFDGEYHLFFQHNPSGIEWGNMTWGHAVSRDLAHWTQLDNALTPDTLGTVYSGSAAVDWGNTTGFSKDGKPPLVAMYTAAGGQSPESKGQPFTQCLAFSTDNGRTWTKYGGNPVIGHIVAENRDPKVIWYPPTRRWIAALYQDGSRYSLHESPDLMNWSKLQDVDAPGSSECPDFFPLPLDGDPSKTRWIFTCADAKYLVGTFDGRRFTPDGGLRQTDFGRNFYAVQSYSDEPSTDGYRIQIAWMRGPRLKGMPFNQQMSFPSEVTLKSTPDGARLFRKPARQIDTLHDAPAAVRGTCAKPGVDDGWLTGLKGEAFHIVADIEPGAASEAGLTVFGEPVRYTVADSTLHALGDAPVAMENGRLHLELIVDRGSIETFAQHGRVAMASCFDPKVGAPPIAVTMKGGGAKVTISATPLISMWDKEPERRP